MLLEISLAKPYPRDFGDSVGVVRRFQRAGQERRLLDWLWRHFRVNARAAQKEEFLRSEVCCGFNDVVLDTQVLE